MQKGLFITVEGGEGVGKSTNLAAIQQLLTAAGKRVVMTREPGGTHLGETLRGILLDPGQKSISSDAELLLMFAARAQHLAEVIRPALERGEWVVCDRFTDATYAYQGGGRGILLSRIAVLEDWAQQGLQPDITLLLDVPVEIGLKRAGDRSAPDRFEQEHLEFFERVRRLYLTRANEFPKRFRIIDANQPLTAVQEQISAVIASVVSHVR